MKEKMVTFYKDPKDRENKKKFKEGSKNFVKLIRWVNSIPADFTAPRRWNGKQKEALQTLRGEPLREYREAQKAIRVRAAEKAKETKERKGTKAKDIAKKAAETRKRNIAEQKREEAESLRKIAEQREKRETQAKERRQRKKREEEEKRARENEVADWTLVWNHLCYFYSASLAPFSRDRRYTETNYFTTSQDSRYVHIEEMRRIKGDGWMRHLEEIQNEFEERFPEDAENDVKPHFYQSLLKERNYTFRAVKGPMNVERAEKLIAEYEEQNERGYHTMMQMEGSEVNFVCWSNRPAW
ncbi:hypothetical protein HDV00_011921 [Rhizophlyctis rosea]|nr:hypothetical protein HDV00_011921 [Rhizophlyctis rosea]